MKTASNIATTITILAISLSTLSLSTLSLSALANNKSSNSHDKPHKRPEFSSIDTNGDKQITREEFSIQELPDIDPDTLFNNIDTNEDEVISEDEFNNHKPPRKNKER